MRFDAPTLFGLVSFATALYGALGHGRWVNTFATLGQQITGVQNQVNSQQQQITSVAQATPAPSQGTFTADQVNQIVQQAVQAALAQAFSHPAAFTSGPGFVVSPSTSNNATAS